MINSQEFAYTQSIKPLATSSDRISKHNTEMPRNHYFGGRENPIGGNFTSSFGMDFRIWGFRKGRAPWQGVSRGWGCDRAWPGWRGRGGSVGGCGVSCEPAGPPPTRPRIARVLQATQKCSGTSGMPLQLPNRPKQDPYKKK